MRPFAVCICVLLFCQMGVLWGQALDPDDTNAAMQLLQSKRADLLQSAAPFDAQHAHQMIDLGLWDEAQEFLEDAPSNLADIQLVRARFAWLNNDFFAAEGWLDILATKGQIPLETKLLRIQLEIEAWRLDSAEQICLDLLVDNPQEEAVVLMLGRIHLLKKNYPKARALAEQVQQWNPDNADAYLLQADAHFWLRENEAAIEPLRTCLELNPLHADARFAYGYAIWRRVNATQLPDMAAQWEIALAVNPLHYLTHWHWGNGHTHLTYEDYADPHEDTIRALLAPIEENISASNPKAKEARVSTLFLQRNFPESVLPQMVSGSHSYLSAQNPAAEPFIQSMQLHTAEDIFRDILEKKAHYGPAHNGLAAVIKQKRFRYLDQYEQLERQIEETVITDSLNFVRVFPDISYYPGDRVAKMIWQQLHTGVVYFPFLQKLGRTFAIPPLHHDLSIAMKDPFFRRATTFDNRQWMDIRGVGTGATGIEYVERGAHLERNVTLHEYVHLFHLYLFTDTEMRAVRARYFHAMEEDLVLDYYSANNEFEYLAQTFPAYFIPQKVHPLNHKSLNTRSDLLEKDTLMYAFIDRLVAKHRAYLAGDSLAMADTWAQTYVRLSENARKARDWEGAIALLDTAYQWDSTYLPVYLTYAATHLSMGGLEEAENWIKQAQVLDETYAPIYLQYADWVYARFLSGEIAEAEAIREQAAHYRTALELEDDLYIRAEINQRFRKSYETFCRIPEAIAIAEGYAVDAPTLSTDLRTHRLRAEAFAKYLKGMMGYGQEVRPFFEAQFLQHPQDYQLLVQYVRVLFSIGEHEEALSLLQPANRLLEAAGNPDPQLFRETARGFLLAQDTNQAVNILTPLTQGQKRFKRDSSLWISVLADAGMLHDAQKLFDLQSIPRNPHALATYHFAAGCLEQAKGNADSGIQSFRQALEHNPYHWEARFRLIALHARKGEKGRVRYLATQGSVLPLPPGPAWADRLETILSALE